MTKIELFLRDSYQETPRSKNSPFGVIDLWLPQKMKNFVIPPIPPSLKINNRSIA